MKVFEKLRYHGFWLLDAFKGGPVKKHLKEIQYILNNNNSEKAQKIRQQRLDALIAHATNTTTFYANKNFKQLTDFPIIDKTILREQREAFLSRNYKNKKLHSLSTSGSTGTPLTMVQNRNKKDRNTADNLYFSGLAGFKIGYKIWYFRIWLQNFNKLRLVFWLQNIVKISVLELKDNYISNVIGALKKDSSTKGFLGYASSYDVICNYLDTTYAMPIESNIKSIIAISERLSNHTKKRLNYYFKAPVVSRYSNAENGILAQQEINTNDSFIINWASYFIEILEMDSNQPVKPGAVGRIVVTDLFNFACPLIRYDTGDVGIFDYETLPPKFKSIEGRKYDLIYNTNGHLISSLIIGDIVNYKGVLQGQLIQKSKCTYEIKLIVSSIFNQEKEMIDKFKDYLGNDAQITINYVTEIPLLQSGKRKIAINECNQKK